MVFYEDSGDDGLDLLEMSPILTDDGSVWNELSSSENQRALSLVWGTSNANNILLTALNIDVRNIVSVKTNK